LRNSTASIKGQFPSDHDHIGIEILFAIETSGEVFFGLRRYGILGIRGEEINTLRLDKKLILSVFTNGYGLQVNTINPDGFKTASFSGTLYAVENA